MTSRRLILPLLLASLLSIDVQAQHIPNSRSWYLYLGSQDEVRQYVLEVGKGPTVVVLHGGFGAEHSYLLDPLLPLTNKRKLVFYDQRGSLRSPAGQLEVSLPKMVEDLEALRQQLGEEKLVLLSHSMGGAVAMAYLAKYPDRVRGLVLTGPVLPIPLSDDFKKAPQDPGLLTPAEQVQADALAAQYWQKQGTRLAAVQAKFKAMPAAASTEAARATPGYYRNLTEQWRMQFASVNIYHADRWPGIEGGKAFYSQAVADAVLKDPAALAKQFETFRPALQAFQGPVEVIMGDEDYCDPGGYVWGKVLKTVPRGRLNLLPEASHSYWLDQPRASRAALTAALDRVFAASRGK
ncbi:alpha/beta hydrolase [Undibacterium sp. TS12]|uniref:alpha/beta fold hydrolase n=1 Tax=Undibacterium sp. TS12 TaxID=2908202 RepID=UPI001F4CBBAB|nr:alpha/beta hydrolase [Undibacterium sp. TS12]MCH8620305.1 alpha/beta hydrolase [Undibacterium sp. TS12]